MAQRSEISKPIDPRNSDPAAAAIGVDNTDRPE
jgi:hypothetical protein